MSDLDTIVSSVASARKYHALCQDTVRRAAEQELSAPADRSLKEIVKATKRRLHQIYGAFGEQPDYEATYQQLATAVRANSETELRAACRHILGLHQSTRERLIILERFYGDIWEVTGLPRSILDLGCGLNPLAWPWMGLEPGCRITALDIDRDRVDFLNSCFALAGPPLEARCQDILVHPPEDCAEVALLLKMSPTLERQESGATGRVIAALRAPWVVVSFAVRSLSGRDKGMVANYRRQFLALADRQGWVVTPLRFETELAFMVELGWTHLEGGKDGKN